jgi:nucleotide-binding universal stress UspA family protein
MAIARILCPTDFSPDARQAVAVATRMARDTGAELVFTHVCHVPATLRRLDGPFPPEVTDEMVEHAQRALDDTVLDARAAGASYAGNTLLRGVPWSEICGLLEGQAFPLCVIGTHGRTGIARFLLGSVAERVVRHAPCSVLVVPRAATPAPFAHVLVPTDLSGGASAALDLAVQLVVPHGSITLLHVIETPAHFALVADVRRDLEIRALVALEHAAAQLQEKTAATVHTCTRVGFPAVEILGAIDDDRATDLVVMGNHGRSGIARVMLGSVAEKVVRHAGRPVLIARTVR